jgi:hypothetical protein
MGYFLALHALLVFSGFTVAACERLQLPCEHFLRPNLVFANFFEHCECQYGDWIEVATPDIVTAIEAPVSECDSGLKIPRIQYQPVISGVNTCNGETCEECIHQYEEVFVCKTDCTYEDGSSVAVEDADSRQVPWSQCISGQASPVDLQLVAVGGYKCSGTECSKCQDKSEKQYMCHPTVDKVLGPKMGIGRGEQSTQSQSEFFSQRDRRQEGDDSRSTKRCSHELLEACQAPGEEREPLPDKPHSPVSPLPVAPLPYNDSVLGAQFKRDSQSDYCRKHNSTRHVLFLLDASGSVLRENFNKVVTSLSKLVLYFCRPVKVAVMTFSHNHYLEFCFDCFGNTCDERKEASRAMGNIEYHTGLTHSGSATKCACRNLLNRACGFDIRNKTCLDVIYITDGHSNDPDPNNNGSQNVCNEVKCLYDAKNISTNVYAFGIADINYDELKCITGKERKEKPDHIFLFQNFTEFESRMNFFINSGLGLCFNPNPSVSGGIHNNGCLEDRF